MVKKKLLHSLEYAAAAALVITVLYIVEPFKQIMNYVLADLSHALVLVLVVAICFHFVNRLTPRVDFQHELREGNIAVSVFLGLLAIALAILFM